MVLSKYLWGKIFQIGLIMLLITLDVTIYGTEYVKGLVGIVPWIRSTFILGTLLTLIGLRGLLKTCKTNRKFKLIIGRSLYLPTLTAIAITILTKQTTIHLVTSTQFLISIMLFFFGYFISWTA